MEYYADINIIALESEIDKQALFAVSSIMGALGFFTAFLMIYLMREKRGYASDRRKLSRPLDFTDRRSNTDRRSL